MKKTTLLLLIYCSLLFSLNVKAQASTEFEGVITYSHQITATNKDYDPTVDYEYIGKQSDFYYKAGNYKWLNQDAFMEMDMFRTKDTIEFLKMQLTDTVFFTPNNFLNEKIIDYKILKNADTVLGHVCNVLVINATADGNTWIRKYSFSNEFPVNPSLFKNYKYNSTNVIYSLMKALPLKIELTYPDKKIVYTAIKIEKQSLQENLFEFEPGTIFKSMM